MHPVAYQSQKVIMANVSDFDRVISHGKVMGALAIAAWALTFIMIWAVTTAL